MRFEWDEDERWSNLRKHGIDFAEVEKVFEGETATLLDDRFLPDVRFLTFGLLRGVVVSIVHLETDESIRLISARKASKHEQEIYFQKIKN
jgi:uncharacterized protein